MRTFSCNVGLVLIFATSYFGMAFAQSKFTVSSTDYNCACNIICIGEAHSYSGDNGNRIRVGMLSLLSETDDIFDKGLAYYREPVQLRDLVTRQPASFNTSFTIYMRNGSNVSQRPGDGMAFVISADNATPGGTGANFGIFSGPNSTTSFKSVVVEFDSWMNGGKPEYDISNNHVGLDFMNIKSVAAENASKVNVFLYNEYTVYVWVEYSKETKKLEVRISNLQSRPVSPLLNHTVNLFDFVEEYMWVGFSSASGSHFSNNYIGDWTFESSLGSYGISTSTCVPNKNKLVMILGISVGVPGFLVVCSVIALFVKRYGTRQSYRNIQVLLGFTEEEDSQKRSGLLEVNGDLRTDLCGRQARSMGLFAVYLGCLVESRGGQDIGIIWLFSVIG